MQLSDFEDSDSVLSDLPDHNTQIPISHILQQRKLYNNIKQQQIAKLENNESQTPQKINKPENKQFIQNIIINQSQDHGFSAERKQQQLACEVPRQQPPKQQKQVHNQKQYQVKNYINIEQESPVIQQIRKLSNQVADINKDANNQVCIIEQVIEPMDIVAEQNMVSSNKLQGIKQKEQREPVFEITLNKQKQAIIEKLPTKMSQKQKGSIVCNYHNNTNSNQYSKESKQLTQLKERLKDKVKNKNNQRLTQNQQQQQSNSHIRLKIQKIMHSDKRNLKLQQKNYKLLPISPDIIVTNQPQNNQQPLQIQQRLLYLYQPIQQSQSQISEIRQILDEGQIVSKHWQLTTQRDRIMSEIRACLKEYRIPNKNKIIQQFYKKQQIYEKSEKNSEKSFEDWRPQRQLKRRSKYIQKLNIFFTNLLNATKKSQIISQFIIFLKISPQNTHIFQAQIIEQKQKAAMEPQKTNNVVILQSQSNFQSCQSQKSQKSIKNPETKQVNKLQNNQKQLIDNIRKFLVSYLPVHIADFLDQFKDDELTDVFQKTIRDLQNYEATRFYQEFMRFAKNKKIKQEPKSKKIKQSNSVKDKSKFHNQQKAFQSDVRKIRKLNDGKLQKKSTNSITNFLNATQKIKGLVDALQHQVKKNSKKPIQIVIDN